MMYLLLAWLWWPLCQWWTRRRCAAAPQKILLLQTAKIGDMVCTLPLIAALAEAGKHHGLARRDEYAVITT